MTALRPLPLRATAILLMMVVFGLLAAPVSAQLSKADIDRLNIQAQQEGWTFIVSENEATQYSLDQLCGFKVPDVLPGDVRFDPMISAGTMALPSSFDWRTQGSGLPPIRNQGGCGSCWAFATVGPLECNIMIKDGLEVNLSEQYLVSCNSNGYGCAGGWWEHRMHQNAPDGCGGVGAVLETAFPYQARDLACGCPYPHEYTIDGWGYIGQQFTMPSVSQMKLAIMQYGPISVAVSVNDAFQSYSGGIFNGCANGDINHAVVVVGWDDAQGPGGVWFMRNSWGAGWGEAGYMRIPYNCSYIGYNATYINYRGSVWFASNSTLAPAPADVTFTAQTALDATAWDWNFGDGQVSTLQNPSHSYQAPGCYDVTVTIQTSSGQFSSTEERCVMVHADTFLTATGQGLPGQPVSLDVSLHNFVPINEIVFPLIWDGPDGLYLDSVSTVGLRTSHLAPLQMHIDMTRATYKLMVSGSQAEIPPGAGPVLRLWFTVPIGATGGTNSVSIAGYINGPNTYMPTVTTDNGTYQPSISAGAVVVCKGGDVNDDGIGPDLSDLSFLIGYLLAGSPQPPNMQAANVDGVGPIDLSDLSRLIGHMVGTGVQLTCK